MTRQERNELGAAKVAAYTDWLKAGMPAGEMPAVPTNADYSAARRYAPTARAAAPARRDDCPDCGHQRTELICAPGRFYCARCGIAGPGPAPLRVGAQLTLEQAAA